MSTGNTGTLTDFQLELCSNEALFSPYLVNNDILEIRTGSNYTINQTNLLCEDQNNTASELQYTIISSPRSGQLLFNNNLLRVGSIFTQNDINMGTIKYQHSGTMDEQDSFVFVVEDGKGGWVEPTTFMINMTAGGNTGIDILFDATRLFKIFPNPATDIIHISQIDDSNMEWTIEVTTIDGKKVTKKQFNNTTALNIAAYQSGVYILNLSSKDIQISHRVCVIRE